MTFRFWAFAVALWLTGTFAIGAPFAYVANSGSNSVSVIDIATLTVIATIGVGTSPVSVAVHPNRNRVYVANSGSNSISIIDTTTNSVVGTLSMGSPNGLAVVADSYLYGVNRLTPEVVVFNLDTNSLIGTLFLPNISAAPEQIAYNRTTNTAYVADPGSSRVWFVGAPPSANSLPVVRGSQNITSPIGIAANTGSSRPGAYAVNQAGNSVALVDTTFTSNAAVGATPLGIAVRPGPSTVPRIVVSNRAGGNATILDFNETTATTIATVTAGSAASGVSITPDGRYALVANENVNQVTVIDLNTNAVVRTVPVGTRPKSMGTFTGPALVSASMPPPVFPVTVTSNITATTATATAIIQPRAQDVGTSKSIYVFAHAPATIVPGAAASLRAPATVPIPALAQDAVVCVLAQVDASGRLVPVTASTMTAVLTGVLQPQSQAITLLNNVPINNVAGATVFVGYGTSAADMLANGLYQTALSLPGPVQCASSLDTAPAPKSPGSLTGLWWAGLAESGWGIHFTQRGNNIFAAWYTYDLAGNPKWYVSTCAMPGAANAPSGTCTGQLLQVTGPGFFGVPTFDSRLVHSDPAGNLSVTFQDAGSATMTYSGVAGFTRTVPLTRQPLATGNTAPAIDYTDIWYSPSESGWGMAMAQQFGVVFLAWYVYDNGGQPTWRVATCTLSGSSCSGTLYLTRGPQFGPTFNSNLVSATQAGTIIVSFIDANTAILSWRVNGLDGTRVVTRQVF